MAGESILEYARKHELTQDYTLLSPFDTDCISDCSSDFELDAEQASEALPPLDLSKQPLLDERWHVDRLGAGFLREVQSVLEELSVRDYPTRREERRALRMASPLLSTDPSLDMAKLFPDRDHGHALVCTSETPRPLDDDPEAEARLCWPASEPSLLARVENDVQHERLCATRETAQYLRSIMHPEPLPQDECLSELKVPRGRTRMSSPLLPLSPPPSDPEPLEGVFDTVYTSTPTDPTSMELLDIKSEIEDERPSPAGSDMIATFLPSSTKPDSPDVETTEASFSVRSARKRPRPEDLKIEGPLTPRDYQSSPFKRPKTVSFMKDLVQEIRKDENDEVFGNLSDTDDGFEIFFNDVIDLAAPARQQIENEQLQMEGATLRLEVPPVDFTLPPAPWTVYSRVNVGRYKYQTELSAQHQLLMEVKAGVLSKERPWSVTETMHLRWDPIPRDLDTSALQEDCDVRAFDDYSSHLDFDHPGEPSLWKPEGLRILDPDEDEGAELEDMPLNIMELSTEEIVSKRYNDMLVDEMLPTLAQKTVQRPHETFHEISSFGRPLSRRGPTANPSTNFLSSISTKSALGMFMQVQSGVPPCLSPVKEKPEPILHEQLKDVDAKPFANEEFAAIPTPVLPSPLKLKPAAFIVSTDLLVQRSLMHAIRNLYPSADLIERDFSTPTIISQIVPHPGAQQVSQSVNTSEADLLLAPSAGLVLTTLQKLKQRPLPGQATSTSSHTTLLTRLTRLSSRYERLVLLVSESITMSGPSSLDNTSLSALNDLSNFVSACEADIRVVCVPGGEKELTHWIVATMARFAGHGISLLPEETVWERWLRHAGMDAFSAQAVLGELKDHDSEGFCGLARLVAMDQEDRVARFSATMGGERVLRRVGRLLDQGFNSRLSLF
ncbi:hypothetical protein MBLNU457_5315t1 [Dothideomycetes sp. NU457]